MFGAQNKHKNDTAGALNAVNTYVSILFNKNRFTKRYTGNLRLNGLRPGGEWHELGAELTQLVEQIHRAIGPVSGISLGRRVLDNEAKLLHRFFAAALDERDGQGIAQCQFFGSGEGIGAEAVARYAGYLFRKNRFRLAVGTIFQFFGAAVALRKAGENSDEEEVVRKFHD